MSNTEMINACPVCGAEESLDALLVRMIEDDQVRRLIADVLTASFPLGGLVVRYLRLFKPPKQKLRLGVIHKVLAELVPDIQRNTIERNGRIWQAGVESWKGALQAVFDAHDKGKLAVPLQGNGYLYAVLMRTADRGEAAEEKQVDADRKNRTGQSGVVAAGDALYAPVQEPGTTTPAAPRRSPIAGPKVDSPLVRQMKAELAAKKGGTS